MTNLFSCFEGPQINVLSYVDEEEYYTREWYTVSKLFADSFEKSLKLRKNPKLLPVKTYMLKNIHRFKEDVVLEKFKNNITMDEVVLEVLKNTADIDKIFCKFIYNGGYIPKDEDNIIYNICKSGRKIGKKCILHYAESRHTSSIPLIFVFFHMNMSKKEFGEIIQDMKNHEKLRYYVLDFKIGAYIARIRRMIIEKPFSYRFARLFFPRTFSLCEVGLLGLTEYVMMHNNFPDRKIEYSSFVAPILDCLHKKFLKFFK